MIIEKKVITGPQLSDAEMSFAPADTCVAPGADDPRDVADCIYYEKYVMSSMGFPTLIMIVSKQM